MTNAPYAKYVRLSDAQREQLLDQVMRRADQTLCRFK